MLLIANIDVIEQRTLARQKGAANFKSLGMPVLTLLMLLWRIERCVFFHLNDKADFSAEAKVADCKRGNFRNERVASKFKLVLTFFD